MKQKLSVVLLAQKIRTGFHSLIHEYLEILPEMANSFEIIILESEMNSEISESLAMEYPQIALVPCSQTLDFHHAIKRGIQLATGERILIQYQEFPFSLHQLFVWREGLSVADAIFAKFRSLQPPYHDIFCVSLCKRFIFDMVKSPLDQPESLASELNKLQIHSLELRYDGVEKKSAGKPLLKQVKVKSRL